MHDPQRDLGPQPLIATMERWHLGNHDLVEASPEQLTHKQVQRAKSGRRLTLKMMMKLARALNLAIAARLTAETRPKFAEYLHRDLFSYAKGYDPERPDANAAILPPAADAG